MFVLFAMLSGAYAQDGAEPIVECKNLGAPVTTLQCGASTTWTSDGNVTSGVYTLAVHPSSPCSFRLETPILQSVTIAPGASGSVNITQGGQVVQIIALDGNGLMGCYTPTAKTVVPRANTGDEVPDAE